MCRHWFPPGAPRQAQSDEPLVPLAQEGGSTCRVARMSCGPPCGRVWRIPAKGPQGSRLSGSPPCGLTACQGSNGQGNRYVRQGMGHPASRPSRDRRWGLAPRRHARFLGAQPGIIGWRPVLGGALGVVMVVSGVVLMVRDRLAKKAEQGLPLPDLHLHDTRQGGQLSYARTLEVPVGPRRGGLHSEAQERPPVAGTRQSELLQGWRPALPGCMSMARGAPPAFADAPQRDLAGRMIRYIGPRGRGWQS